jgi:hypothetical protein
VYFKKSFDLSIINIEMHGNSVELLLPISHWRIALLRNGEMAES